MDIKLSDAVFQKASLQIDTKLIDGDIEQWVVYVCFRSHPHFLWNFMLDTVALAKNDDHLSEIGVSLAEHILAHYGSMMPDFEEMASTDQKFKRMLTGVRRHRMSDEVWLRLRIMQSEVSDPLAGMIPLENGAEYMSASLTQSDRANADKGLYFRDECGDWQQG
jgi:hypothetical protein